MANWLSPNFLSADHEIYEAEKRTIHTLEDWIAFDNKWYPDFPHMEHKHFIERNTVRKIPKGWNEQALNYAISREAKYEMMSTRYTIGYPLLFPHLYNKEALNGQKTNLIRSFICWYDEIFTTETTAHCPVCNRKLVIGIQTTSISDD